MIFKGRFYTPEEVLPLVIPPFSEDSIEERKIQKNFFGDLINFTSSRLQMFQAKGIACVRCPIVGIGFVKQKHKEGEPYWHLGLYGMDAKGKSMMMTKDHIHPKSKGGRDCLSNFAPMCSKCNEEKGSDPNVA